MIIAICRIAIPGCGDRERTRRWCYGDQSISALGPARRPPPAPFCQTGILAAAGVGLPFRIIPVIPCVCGLLSFHRYDFGPAVAFRDNGAAHHHVSTEVRVLEKFMTHGFSVVSRSGWARMPVTIQATCGEHASDVNPVTVTALRRFDRRLPGPDSSNTAAYGTMRDELTDGRPTGWFIRRHSERQRHRPAMT